MSAAMEASIESIPSIGFSLLDYSVEADFSAARFFIRKIVSALLTQKMDKHLLLNVNIPAVNQELIKGVKLCKQAYAKYEEDFDERKDPQGKKYYWLTGVFALIKVYKFAGEPVIFFPTGVFAFIKILFVFGISLFANFYSFN